MAKRSHRTREICNLTNGSTGRVTAGSFGAAPHFHPKAARCNTPVILALGV